jgi:hypothetical protein
MKAGPWSTNNALWGPTFQHCCIRD